MKPTAVMTGDALSCPAEGCESTTFHMVEGGYERRWRYVALSGGVLTVGEDRTSDDGDCEYVLECHNGHRSALPVAEIDWS